MQPTPNVLGAPANGLLGRWGGSNNRNRLNPTAIADLAAWYDVSSDASTTSDLIRIDGSNRVSLIADRSGNSGVNCLCLPGTSGNYASTPDSAALSFTDGLDVRARWRCSDWTPSGWSTFAGKRVTLGTASGWSFGIQTGSTGALGLTWWATDGIKQAISTVAVPFTDLSVGCVRVLLSATGGNWTVQFFTSTDTDLETATWTQLGSDRTGTHTGTLILDNAAALEIGALVSGTGEIMPAGVCYATSVRNGTGAIVFHANFALAGKLVSSFTESSSNAATVTINSSGDLGARISGERDLVQLTASKQPIYLPWSGTNYGWLNGVSGNYFSTPDSAAISVTGDIDLRARLQLASWSPSSDQVIIAKWDNSTQNSYWLRILTGGTLDVALSNTGSTSASAASSVSCSTVFSANQAGWVRATWNATSKVVTFFTSSDGTTWTQLGTTGTISIASIFDGTQRLEVGTRNNATNFLSGNAFRAQVLNGINGTVVADFDPSRYTSGTTFTASTGEVWTLNGGAHIVTRTCIYGDGSDDYMESALFSQGQAATALYIGTHTSWTSGDYLFDGTTANSGAVVQTTSTPQLNLNAGSSVAGNTGFALRTRGQLQAIFNGASSSLRVNRGTATTGNAGAGTMNGVTIFANGSGANNGNGTLNEFALYSSAFDTATSDRWALYAGSKWRFSV